MVKAQSVGPPFERGVSLASQITEKLFHQPATVYSLNPVSSSESISG